MGRPKGDRRKWSQQSNVTVGDVNADEVFDQVVTSNKSVDFSKNKIKELLNKKELNYKNVFKFIQIFYLIKTFNNPSIV